MNQAPKITVVTPVYNQADFIEKTIQSVLDQGYENLEYIVIDGGSTDGTYDIIKRYDADLAFHVSEPDSGMYDALQKGFDKSSGDIMFYLNGDDMLYPKTLFSVAEIFSNLNIHWLTGVASSIDEKGRIVGVANLEKWSKYKFFSGHYQWIQQESTFWSRELWNKAGGYIDKNCKLAGDFDLWCRFFQKEQLYTVNTILGAFRWRSSNQLSLEGMGDYISEAEDLLNKHAKSLSSADLDWIDKIKKHRNTHSKNPISRRLHFKTDQEWFQFPSVIKYDRIKQKFFKS